MRTVTVFLAAFSSVLLGAATPATPTTWGGHLVDTALKAHPEVVAIDIAAPPPKGAATTLTFRTTGDRDRVEEPLLDVSGATIGTLSISFATGGDAAKDRRIASAIQTYFSKHAISAINLKDPYPYSRYSANTAAQALVDATMARHPELIVLGMHVTLPGRGNVFLASNIGRVGKLADDDDMRVVHTGRANHEISTDHRRYEVELVLEDATGRNIGALGVVFHYAPGTNKDALNARADAIRDEMARAIPSAVSLLARHGEALTLHGVTSVPGYKGDFDHFAVDLARNRLFLAGEDGAALEVFDLRSGALRQSITGFGVPHSMLFMPATNELLIVDGSKPSQIRDATTLALKRTIALPAGADSVAYDASTGHLWVVTGGKDVSLPYSNLIEISPASGRVLQRVHFDANHVEALAVEQHGNRIFVNVTDKNRIAVIDKRRGAIVAWWPVTEAKQNAPIAIDEVTHRLFVVTRAPGMLLVLNADTGKTIASFKAPERTDEVVWDPRNRRAYVAGGQGYVGVFQQLDADHYAELARIASAPGAKTAILIPALDRLYLAASPGDTRVGGAVLRFDVNPEFDLR